MRLPPVGFANVRIDRTFIIIYHKNEMSIRLATDPSADGCLAPPTRTQAIPAAVAPPKSRLTESPITTASSRLTFISSNTFKNGSGDGFTIPHSDENDADSHSERTPH